CRPRHRRGTRHPRPIPRLQDANPMSTEIKVPVLPESVSDATIATWHKKAGDAVSRDENLVDLETDKVVLEVPSPVDGVLKEIKFQSGDTVTSDQVLAIVEAGAAASDKGGDEAGKKADKKNDEAATAEAKPVQPKKEEAPKPASKSSSGDRSSKGEELPPGARFTANKEGIDPSNVEGTGRRGAVTKEDLLNYAKNAGAGKIG